MLKVSDYTGPIDKPGLYRMPAEVYHKGPAVGPEFSNSLARALLTTSPLHAWTMHPKLNPNWRSQDSERRMEIGQVAHRLVLDAGQPIDILEFKDFRTKDAQAARIDSESRNRIPVLRCDYERAEGLAEPMRNAVENFMGAAIADCLREVVILWQGKNGVWRKAMPDIATPDLRRLCDVKSTATSVHPAACSKRVYDAMYHIQAVHYSEGCDALDPEGIGRREFGFLFAETSEPFAVSPPILLSEAGRAMGAEQLHIASDKFASCLKTDRWPGYSDQPHVAKPPPWVLSQWAERSMSDETLNPEIDAKYANV